MQNTPKSLVWIGIALILITGLIHLIDYSDAAEEAVYKGMLFAANGLAAVIAAIGIWRGERVWGWGLALVIAGGSLLGYVASRTVGLPDLPAEPDAWLEPLGVLSVIAEGLMVVLAGWVLLRLDRPLAVAEQRSLATDD